MRKFIWSFLLLMLGVVTVGAQGTVVTSVANPIKYKELIGGRQVLLKNNSTSRYLCIDASVNDIVRAETLSAPTAATAAYIFTMVPSGDGYNLKCTIDGVGYYVTHVAGGWAGWSNDATSAAVYKVRNDVDGLWRIYRTVSSTNWYLPVANKSVGTGRGYGIGATSTNSNSSDWQIIPVNAENMDLTYNLTLTGGGTKTYTISDWIVGGELPTSFQSFNELADKSSYISCTFPTGTASSDNNTFDVSVSYTEAFPFTISPAVGDDATWYSLTLKGYYLNKGTEEKISLQNQTAFNWQETQLWCFVGNVFDGFRVYNREKGSNYVLTTGDVPTDNTTQGTTYPTLKLLTGNTENTLWDISPSAQSSTGFYMNVHGKTSWKPNARNNAVAFWTSGADAGSTFEVKTPIEHFESDYVYSASKVKVENNKLTAEQDLFGFPTYDSFMAAKNVRDNTNSTIAQLQAALNTLHSAKPVLGSSGYYYIESKKVTGGNNFPASPVPAIYDDIDNENNTQGLVLLNNAATRTTKYVWKVTFDAKAEQITLRNCRGVAPVTKNSSGTLYTWDSVTYNYASAVGENTLHIDNWHATKQDAYTLGNIAYNSDNNPAFILRYGGAGLGNDYSFVPIEESLTIYTVASPTFADGIEPFDITVSYNAVEGYSGYTNVPVGGFFAISNTATVDESKFRVNIVEGYDASVTLATDEDGNKLINVAVAEKANIEHYTVTISPLPGGITPTITYKGSAYDVEETVGNEGQFVFNAGFPINEEDFTINDGGALRWYTQASFNIDTENHEITLTYTPIVPKADSTYRMRAAISGRYAYYSTVKENRPLVTATDRFAAVKHEEDLFITMVADAANDDKYFMLVVGANKYMSDFSGLTALNAASKKNVEFTPHPSVNAWRIKPDGASYLYDDTSQSEVDGDSYGTSDGVAWLFEEVRTAETTLSPAAEGFGTFCMDFPAIVPTEGVKVKYPNDLQDDNNDGLYTMTWQTLTDSIPAYTAVLLEGTAGETYKFYETERCDAATAIADNAMTSTQETGYVYYALAKPAGYSIGFYKFTGTMRDDRGYIRMEAQDAPRVRGFIFDGDDIVTGIETVESQPAEDARVYDLTGRRVAKPTNGIYVINGKKTIINK